MFDLSIFNRDIDDERQCGEGKRDEGAEWINNKWSNSEVIWMDEGGNRWARSIPKLGKEQPKWMNIISWNNIEIYWCNYNWCNFSRNEEGK